MTRCQLMSLLIAALVVWYCEGLSVAKSPVFRSIFTHKRLNDGKTPPSGVARMFGARGKKRRPQLSKNPNKRVPCRGQLLPHPPPRYATAAAAAAVHNAEGESGESALFWIIHKSVSCPKLNVLNCKKKIIMDGKSEKTTGLTS